MIAQWMLYCVAVGALLCAGALAAERALRGFGGPTRWAWAAAIVLTPAIPAAARWLPRVLPPPIPIPAVTVGAGDAGAAVPKTSSVTAEEAPRGIALDLAALDGPLARLWMGSSAAAVLALLAGWAVLERRRRTWRAAVVDGVPVLVSPRTGPAVVGLFRGRIVLPEWVLKAYPDVRALLLAHEREHLRAGDPRLLALGLGAVALMPWNPAAWWQLRRLRLAVEVDCDARVLARRADVRGYAALLLQVGRRASVNRLATVTAFSEPRSFLERRIRIMTSPPVRAAWLRASGFGAAALALTVAACRTPGPAQPPPEAAPWDAVRMPYGWTQPAWTQPVQTQVRIPDAPRPPLGAPREVVAAVRAHYPEVFRAAPTESNALLFVVATDGTIERHARLRPTRTRPANDERMELRMPEGALSEREQRESAIQQGVHAPGVIGPGQVEVLWARRRTPQERTAVEAYGRERLREMEREAALVRALIARYMPRVAARGTSAAYVWLLLDEAGQVVRHGDSRDTRGMRARPSRGLDVSRLSLLVNGHSVTVHLARMQPPAPPDRAQ